MLQMGSLFQAGAYITGAYIAAAIMPWRVWLTRLHTYEKMIGGQIYLKGGGHRHFHIAFSVPMFNLRR